MVEHSPRKSIADLLLDSARQDLAACELLVSSPGMGDAVVGFHAQQAIEKALKAVLSVGNIEFRRTHDLITLLDLLQDHHLPAPPQADWLDELNPYAVEARYGTIEPDGLDRNRAVDAARQVLAWAANQVNVHEQSNPI
jgi:HEPN domain-containing protein